MRLLPFAFVAISLAGSPLFIVVVLGAVVWTAISGFYHGIVNGTDMAADRVPERVLANSVVAGPHLSPMARHGLVVTLRVQNTHPGHWTPTTVGDTPPLWAACLGAGGRVVALPLDWVVGADFEPTYPRIAPRSSAVVDFSAKLDWDYEPVGSGEVLRDCKVGSSKFQALMQWDVNPADQNRSVRRVAD